jgi:5-methylthioadenosine/S-adenosylhomocysteine deaminase
MTFSNLLFRGEAVDLTVEDGAIARIAPAADASAEPGFLLAPAFYNGHTHLAMNLLRGFADDIELEPWLRDHIWPAEAHLTDAIVYAGTRLAILEMIRSGTVFANDMYWHAPAVARAAEEMGIRCAVSMQTIETGGPGRNDPRNIASNRELAGALPRSASEGRVFATFAPHAIYTVCEETLRSIAAQAKAEEALLHIHVSETAGEVAACRAAHGGRTPVKYLDDCGILGPRTVMAHCVHLTDDDIRLIADRGAVIAVNAQSNQKLCSGMFRFRDAVERGGCRAILGTDGASSNNALSMFAEMKGAALLAKMESGDPTAGSAERIHRMATRDGARVFGIDAGEIREGAPALVPGFHPESDLVYAADPSCVDTVVCAGRILMRGGRVPGEAEIVAEARKAAAELVRAR